VVSRVPRKLDRSSIFLYNWGIREGRKGIFLDISREQALHQQGRYDLITIALSMNSKEGV
jgi:hypothetical protein